MQDSSAASGSECVSPSRAASSSRGSGCSTSSTPSCRSSGSRSSSSARVQDWLASTTSRAAGMLLAHAAHDVEVAIAHRPSASAADSGAPRAPCGGSSASSPSPRVKTVVTGRGCDETSACPRRHARFLGAQVPQRAVERIARAAGGQQAQQIVPTEVVPQLRRVWIRPWPPSIRASRRRNRRRPPPPSRAVRRARSA